MKHILETSVENQYHYEFVQKTRNMRIGLIKNLSVQQVQSAGNLVDVYDWLQPLNCNWLIPYFVRNLFCA